jgi:hypothetical protein
VTTNTVDVPVDFKNYNSECFLEKIKIVGIHYQKPRLVAKMWELRWDCTGVSIKNP